MDEGSARYWLTDEPVDLNESDAFDVSEFVDRLAGLIEAGKPPFTVSLSGTWGVGKSTIAEALIARLKPRGIPGVLVDGWTEDLDHLRRSLVIAVGAELKGGPEHRKDVADEIDDAVHLSRTETLPPKPELRLFESLRDIRERPEVFTWLVALNLVFLLLVAASAIWFPSATSAFATLLGATLVFTALQSGVFFRIETAAQSRAPALESVETSERFRKLVTGRAEDAPAKVLVIVDNLDRLQGADALRALAEIRALVEIENSRAIFLIPIDRSALARHIEPSLAPGADGNAADAGAGTSDWLTGKDYLEKFFNLDLLLTKPEILDLREWALSEARKVLPAGDEQDLVTAVQVIAAAASGSPRSVKRIINAVSSRHRLIDPKLRPLPSLAQLALVDGLLTQFPELSDWLSRDPREFLSYRAVLSDEAAAAETSVPLLKWREEQLRSFLLANSEIVLTAPLVRTVMSLRQDRVWRDVTDPGPLQDALDTGQAETYRTAIEAIDGDERALAVLRSVGYIERSVPRFLRDAITNLVAIGDVIAEYPQAAAALHPMAVRSFRGADDANRLRVTRALGMFLFGSGTPANAAELAGLGARFVDSLNADPSGVTGGLVWTVREAGAHLTSDLVTKAHDALSGLSDDLLTPVFGPSADRRLAEGPVAAMYLARLAAWDATADQEPVRVAIDRIQALTDAGWSDPEAMRQIATRAGTQIPLLTDQPEQCQALNGIVKLVRTVPEGDEAEALAALLVNTPGAYDPPARIASALYLPLTSEVFARAVETGITNWLTSASPEYAERLVITHRTALTAFGFDARPLLTRRWIGGEGRRWGELAVEFDGGADPALLATALAGTPDTAYVGLAAEAAGIAEARGHKAAAASLTTDIATRSANLPPANVEQLGDTLTSLRRNDADLSPIVTALETRIAGDPAIGPLTHAIRSLHEHGISDIRALAKPLAVRGSAAGGVELGDINWLARNTGGSTEARRVLIRAIETGPVAEVCPVVDTVAGALHRHSEVRSALARRAVSGVTEEEATRLLTSAGAYDLPGGAEVPNYRQDLTTVAQQWPSTTDLVNRLQ